MVKESSNSAVLATQTLSWLTDKQVEHLAVSWTHLEYLAARSHVRLSSLDLCSEVVDGRAKGISIEPVTLNCFESFVDFDECLKVGRKHLKYV